MKLPREKNNVVVDESISSTSTNPVQNKVIKAELDRKLNLSGGTLTGNLTTRQLIPNSDFTSLGNTSKRYNGHFSGVEIFGGAQSYIDFHYNNSNSDYTARILENASGSLLAYNTISNGSDRRLKENIKDIDDKYMDLLDELEVKTYNFKNSKLEDCGLIAQDVLELEKESGIEKSILIRGTGEKVKRIKNGKEKEEIDYYALNYNNLVALLLKKYNYYKKE